MHKYLDGFVEFMQHGICEDFDIEFPPVGRDERDLGPCGDIIKKLYCFRQYLEKGLTHNSFRLKRIHHGTPTYNECRDEVALFVDEIACISRMIEDQVCKQFAQVRYNRAFRFGIGWRIIMVLKPSPRRYKVQQVPHTFTK